MDKLLSNIAAQRKEVEAKIEALLAELEALYEVSRRIDKAEAAMRGQSLYTLKNVRQVKPPKSALDKSRLTIKEMVVEVLKGQAGGMVALDILAGINSRFEKDYPRTSLSPQLSRLKQSNTLRQEGKRWLLNDSGKMETPM